MRPGTYIPTHPREVGAFATERFQKKRADLSKQLSESENEYRNLGCRYHFLPVHFREQLVNLDLAMDAFSALTVQEASDTELGYTADLIHHFTSCRAYRDAAQRVLYFSDLPTAEREIRYWEELQDDVETDLEAVAYCVSSMTTKYVDNSYIDDETDAAKAVVMRKTWLMALPEVVQAFELGSVETEEQAIAMVITPFQEELVEPAVLGAVHALPVVKQELVAEAAAAAAQNNQ